MKREKKGKVRGGKEGRIGKGIVQFTKCAFPIFCSKLWHVFLITINKKRIGKRGGRGNIPKQKCHLRSSKVYLRHFL
jgi:hypothetical protein